MLIGRELGKIPVSIPTAVALESLINPTETLSFSVTNRDIWINVRTLIRNLISTVGVNVKPDINDVLSDLIEEIEVIKSVVGDYQRRIGGACFFYTNDHKSLFSKRILPAANIKMAKTEKQVAYKELEDNLIDYLITDVESEITIGDYIVEGNDKKGIILTHQPIDLLSCYHFADLILLESHTGTFKDKFRWYTKITGGSKNVIMPFNTFTLQIFGDNSIHFSMYPTVVRSKVYTLARDCGWNASTTADKINEDIKSLKHGTDNIIYNIIKPLATKKLYF